MNDNLDSELDSVSKRVFEQLCFMCPSPEPGEDEPDFPIEAVASVDFKGPSSGTLFFSVAGGLLFAIASNMLADDAPSKCQQLDALCEIANVICGNILTSVSGPGKEFRIDIPKIVQRNAFNKRYRERPSARVHLILDQGQADILMFLYDGCNQ